MDPIAFALTCLALYGICTRNPLMREAVQEWQASRRGETTTAAEELRQRLLDAGITPADGGPMRQYLGNVWRDYWRDADNNRRTKRTEQAVKAEVEAVRTWWERLADLTDEDIARRVDGWKAEHPGSGDPTPPPAGEEPVTVIHPDNADSPHQEAPSTSSPHPDPTPPGGQDKGPIRVTATVGDPIRPPHQRTAEPDTREPIRVAATVGSPTPAGGTTMTDIAALTAGGTMTLAAANGREVTGVGSGAAEARAIQQALESANGEYLAALQRIQARIQQLGEQTVATVQMSARSRVVDYTAQAAEAAAAAQAAARSCGVEVGPLLGAVAREFDRLSS